MDNNVLRILSEVLDYISNIEESLQGLGFSDYHNNRRVKIAVVQNFDLLFDEVVKLPSDFREDHWAELWDEFEQLRFKFINSDFGIDEDIVWKTAKHKLRKLKTYVKKIVREKESYKLEDDIEDIRS